MREMRDGAGREDWREARSDEEGRIERGRRQRGEGLDGGGGRGMEAISKQQKGSIDIGIKSTIIKSFLSGEQLNKNPRLGFRPV